jgi:ppGpp synthetase/RelA/SpoT-type nucleotidyltranferase
MQILVSNQPEIQSLPKREIVLNTNALQDLMKKFENDGSFSWESCEEIWNDYFNQDKVKIREEAADNLHKELKNIQEVHSIRVRAKEGLSLIRKIIEKKGSNTLKYEDLNADNYDKLITDLIGARLLIRYKHQWLDVHKRLRELFDRSRDRYMEKPRDYVEFYIDDCTARSFVEKPVVYIRKGDNTSIYDDETDIKIEESKQGYRSIHYVVKYNNQYVEIQVRTIFEEAWSECDHDFVYKEPEGVRKILQKRTSDMLSSIAHQGDELSSFMFDVNAGRLLNLPDGCDVASCQSVAKIQV